MLYLFGDESNDPRDECWGMGVLITNEPRKHATELRNIRRKNNYIGREMKYNSTDYSQVLASVKCFDYFLSSDLAYKLIVKDNSIFDINYYVNNRYGLTKEELAYLQAYRELCSTINPAQFGETKKRLIYDQKGFVKPVSLIDFLKKRDLKMDAVFPKDSKESLSNEEFSDSALLIQLADWITGTIISFTCDRSTEESSRSRQVKNIFRQTISSQCPGMIQKLKKKTSFYYPSFTVQKMNIMYWTR